MKFSTIALSALAAQLALAAPAPAPVVVTNYHTTMVTVTVAAGAGDATKGGDVSTSTDATKNAATTTTVAAQLKAADAGSAAASSTASVAAVEVSSESAAPSSSAAESTAAESTAKSTADSASSSASSGFQKEILDAHNAKRALHGMKDLVWDDTVAAYAQDYADKYDCSGTLVHSGGKYGENLGIGYTTSGCVDAWYNEGKNYNYGDTCNTLDHFTAVIWKSTTKLGCASKYCDSYHGTYIICSYDPAGNIIGQCDDNVLPPV